MRSITVIIPTYNEAENLEQLLPLVDWADEVLVIDSFSEDDSIQIAQKYGAKIEQHVYENSAAQKNRAIEWASHEWIFLIDADERPTAALISEIQSLLKQKSIEKEAYWIGRRNYFLNKRVRYSGWQNDAVIRFFNKNHCRYAQQHVHAEVECSGKVGRLNEKLIHYTFKDFDHFLEKMHRYAKWSAKDHLEQTKSVGLFHLLLKPFFRFFKHYILQGGILDGRVGFIISVLMAWGVLLRYLYILELQSLQKK